MSFGGHTTQSSRVWIWALVLFVFAAMLRVGWLTVRYHEPSRSQTLEYPDEEAYWLAARSLAAGHGLRDEFGYRATYMPAYPAFLALFADSDRPLWWARLSQALLAAWVAPATFLLARRWNRWSEKTNDAGSSRLAILAGLAAAVDPFLVFFSGLLLTEALFAAGLTSAWIVVMIIGVRLTGRSSKTALREPLPSRPASSVIPSAVLSGLLLGLCVLLRPSAAMLVAATTALFLVGRQAIRLRWQAAAIVVLVVLLVLVPWGLRNRALIGQWRWLTTRGGISLYDGFQPGANGASDLAHTKRLPEVQDLSESAWDRYFREQAWAAIRQDPARAVLLAWKKLQRTWSLGPNVAAYRNGPLAVISATWTGLLLVFAAIGLWTRRRAAGACVMLLLPVIVFTLLHMVFVGSVRYRVPVMPMVMVLSAAGLNRVLTKWIGRPVQRSVT